MNDTESRVRFAYHAFRVAFRSDPPPHWEDLSDWQRDAIWLAYLQGKRDAEAELSKGIATNIEEAAAEIERLRAAPEQLAQMIESYTAEQIKLAAGEMTAQELRTVKAVQGWWAAAIRQWGFVDQHGRRDTLGVNQQTAKSE